MSEAIKNSVEQLGDVSQFMEQAQPEQKKPSQTTVVYERKVDQYGRSFATGKRKRAIVRVHMKEGSGSFTINGREASAFFPRSTHQTVIKSPFDCVKRDVKKFDVVANVVGGGCTGQAEGVRLAISKALFALDPSLRPALKLAGYLTRDSRVVERKKYGLKKARKRFQFSKR